MSGQADEIRREIEEKKKELAVSVMAEKYEDAAILKSKIADLENALQITENADKRATPTEAGPRPSQIDPDSLSPEMLHMLGVSPESVVPMSPGFEHFIDKFRESSAKTSAELINEVGMLSSRIRNLNGYIQGKTYRGNEAGWLLAGKELGLLVPIMNQAIGLISAGEYIIEACGDISDKEQMFRVTHVGHALTQMGVKPERAYKYARRYVDKVLTDEDFDVPGGGDGNGEI